MFFVAFVCGLLPCLFLALWVLISSKSSSVLRESLTPFECGFDSKHKGKVPFSIRFFVFILLFLVFDIEVVFFVFLPESFYWSLGVMLSFVLIVVIILVYVLEEEFMAWMS